MRGAWGARKDRPIAAMLEAGGRCRREGTALTVGR
jgi:hypothetical protein